MIEAGDARTHLIGPQHPDDGFGAALHAFDCRDGGRQDLAIGAPDVRSGGHSLTAGEVYIFSGLSL